MSSALAEQNFTPWFHTPNIRAANPYSPASALSEFTAPHPTTGTEDDDDEPEDEHPGENEASERETNDATEAPEEFETDDEDGRTPR
jgi:hypothetical protein